MAGRSLTLVGAEERRKSGKGTGLFYRLRSHANGRRSGDQFCVYVCDRLIVPTLTPDQLRAIGDGTTKLDDLTRALIQRELSYRYAVVADGATAYRIEAGIIKTGLAGYGLPFLQYSATGDPEPPPKD